MHRIFLGERVPLSKKPKQKKKREEQMVNKKLKEVIQYFNCTGEITIITKECVLTYEIAELDGEILNKKVRSSQSDSGHLTVWMEL